jgi:hypothetical protein
LGGTAIGRQASRDSLKKEERKDRSVLSKETSGAIVTLHVITVSCRNAARLSNAGV